MPVSRRVPGPALLRAVRPGHPNGIPRQIHTRRRPAPPMAGAKSGTGRCGAGRGPVHVGCPHMRRQGGPQGGAVAGPAPPEMILTRISAPARRAARPFHKRRPGPRPPPTKQVPRVHARRAELPPPTTHTAARRPPHSLERERGPGRVPPSLRPGAPSFHASPGRCPGTYDVGELKHTRDLGLGAASKARVSR